MWHFPQIGSWSVGSNPKYDEFFVDDARDVAQSLIREISQNSGDASRKNVDQVTLKFHFGELDRVTFQSRYMPGLSKHLKACDARAQDLLARSGDVRFLAIEDFGTTGLIGEYSSDDDEDSGFLKFWKRYGDSGKVGGAGGRHGVGKSTLSAASRLRFFYGVTIRADGQKLLYGQAALRLHRLPGDHTLFEPYGLYSPALPPDWPCPFQGEDSEQFISDFGLARDGEPGLSLVVPYPVVGVTHESLVAAVIEHCFHQILSGRLRIEVDETVLERETILDAATEARPDLVGALDLSLEAVTLSPSEFIRPLLGRPVGNLEVNDFSAADVELLRSKWSRGDPVAVEIPVRVRPRGESEETGNVQLFLRQTPEPDLARETYVRGRLSVPEAPKIGSKSCIGLLVADEGPVSKLLGDSENPAHTRWTADRVKGTYVDAPATIRAIKLALHDLYVIAGQIEEKAAIKDALKDFFWIPRRPIPTETPIDSETTKPKLEIEVEATKRSFEVTQVANGFTIRRQAVSDNDETDARVWVAYNVRRGNPKWSPADFRLDDASIEIAVTGDGSIERYDDHLVVRGSQPGFSAKVTGFVASRDLRVRVEGFSPSGEEADA